MKVKVAVCLTREGGGGVIEVYEVPEKYFVEKYTEIDPQTEEEWYALVEWVREVGILLYEVSPDYTITLPWF
jgi:hypothetical protein